MISFSCPNCNAPINIDDSAAGQQGECIKCKSLIIVPGRSSTEARRDASRTSSSPTTAANSSSNSWYVLNRGKEFGPFSDDQLKRFSLMGQIIRESLVRMETQTEWSRAQDVEGLFAEPPKLRMARPQAAASAMPIAPTAAVVVPTAVPYSPAVLSARRPNQPAKKSGNRLLLALGGVASVCLIGGAAWFLSGRGEQASDAAAKVGANIAVASAPTGGKSTTSGTTPRANNQPATKIDGEWYFEGIPISPKFSQAAVLTIQGNQGSWREINSDLGRPVSNVSIANNGVGTLEVDGFLWVVKPLPTGELYFVQEGKSSLFFSPLKPYDKNAHKPDPVAASTESLPISSVTWKELDDIYNIKHQRTDLQKDAAWRSYKDKRIQWNGEVRSVKELFGSLTVDIRMNDDTITRDLQIKLLPSERAKAEQLAEGSHITFAATLVDYAGAILPFRLKDGVISKASTAETPSARTKVNTASTVSLPISSVTWKELDDIYDIAHQRTDLQKDAAWRSYKGKRVQWSGEVRSVEDSLGSLTLGVRMDEDTLSYDLQIQLLPSERMKAEQLSEGGRVTFAATLVDYAGVILPFQLKDGVIITGGNTSTSKPPSQAVAPPTPSDPFSYDMPHERFQDHPQPILDALREGKEVWSLTGYTTLDKLDEYSDTYFVLGKNGDLEATVSKRDGGKPGTWQALATGGKGSYWYRAANKNLNYVLNDMKRADNGRPIGNRWDTFVTTGSKSADKLTIEVLQSTSAEFSVDDPDERCSYQQEDRIVVDCDRGVWQRSSVRKDEFAPTNKQFKAGEQRKFEKKTTLQGRAVHVIQ